VVLGCTLQSVSLIAVYIVIYRPDSQVVSELFFEQLTSLLQNIAAYRCRMIVCSDFNIHVNEPHDRHSQRLAEIIESFDLSQVVSGPTHRDGNTLDLVLTQPISCDVLVSYSTTVLSLPGFRVPVSPFHGRLNKCDRGRNLT